MATIIMCNVQELCRAICISEHCLTEIVAYGIVKPEGESVTDWVFTDQDVALIKKAVRLQRDLELDWLATALAVSLLEQIDHLHADNLYLKQRLKRLESAHIHVL
ncbi:chaperone modulatory protein CbpM [Entomomonas moraniae]|uniref:Chaperone modulatory protein CbpM n=1 Tax=Entomomonas moraniae TaxID=2213226 RepID=A0A3Q9JKC6_9GAMM|nr:chaperone modulator CbpM [Entomomonas moraniae]AZS49468.1 chaperone modulatory protein CbpM [Entomomonas moraniae]